MKTLYVNPVNGIAGDMLAAALVDLGADQDRVQKDQSLQHAARESWRARYRTDLRRGYSSTLSFDLNDARFFLVNTYCR